jgi:hypothetical protein
VPWQTAPCTIYSSPASGVYISGDGNITPVLVGKGQPDARFMLFDFYNPGGVGTADVTVRGVTITAYDGLGSVIAPSSAMSGAKIINASTLAVCGYVSLSSANTAAPFYIPVNLAALNAPYGTTIGAYVAVDVAINPSATEFMLRAASEQAFYAGSGPVDLITRSPAPGAVFPVDSKISTISSFALGFNVGHTALMPVSGARGQAGITAMKLLFENTNSAPVAVTSVALAVKDRSGSLLNADAVASAFYLLDEAGNTVASSAAPASGNIVLQPTSYYAAGNSTGCLTVVFDMSPSAAGIFYLELAAASSVGTLPVASVNPIAGENFGSMTSGMISVQAPDFDAAAHAFPNPFDPAVAPAHVEYYLPAACRTWVRIFTITGKPVAELVSGSEKQAGLHSEDVWDAGNGTGNYVKSGVYIVLIEAEDVVTGVKYKAVKKLVVLR